MLHKGLKSEGAEIAWTGPVRWFTCQHYLQNARLF